MARSLMYSVKGRAAITLDKFMLNAFARIAALASASDLFRIKQRRNGGRLLSLTMAVREGTPHGANASVGTKYRGFAHKDSLWHERII